MARTTSTSRQQRLAVRRGSRISKYLTIAPHDGSPLYCAAPTAANLRDPHVPLLARLYDRGLPVPSWYAQKRRIGGAA